jgi:hypothetical protein
MPSPWPFLLNRLGVARRVAITHAEFVGAGLDSASLLAQGVIERQAGGHWRAPGCEHVCQPNLDIETRYGEELIGVACPYDPPCWPGWQWVRSTALDVFVCSAKAVFEVLRPVNGLLPLEMPNIITIEPVGRWHRRGRDLPIVWVPRLPPAFETICAGLRHTLGGDGLIVLVGHLGPGLTDRRLPDDVVVLGASADDHGNLALWRVLDILDPNYRQKRVSEPNAIFDDVSIYFATVRGQRHSVRVNGHELDGFARSDLKFMRLLYLAAYRAADSDIDDGGWMDKFRLQGDDKDHDLESLREELKKSRHPTFAASELKALIKSSPNRDGRIRLAVAPANIRFDPSLADLVMVGEQQTKGRSGTRPSTPGSEKLAANLRQGAQVAGQLFDAARKLGVPTRA